MKAYKGFKPDMTCRGFKYEEGKEYAADEAKVCESGFHASEHPLDCLCYYEPGRGSVYHEVEVGGDIDRSDGDTKVVGTKIKIGARLTIARVVKAAIDFVFNKVKPTSGNGAHAVTSGNGANAATSGYGAHAVTSGNGAHAATSGNGAHAVTSGNGAHAVTSGYGAHAVTSGYGAHAATSGSCAYAATSGNYANAATSGNHANAATSGYRARAEVHGKDAVAAVLGRECRARGGVGCWLVLTERDEQWHVIGIKAVRVDGEKYKADTWYEMVEGEIVEAEE